MKPLAFLLTRGGPKSASISLMFFTRKKKQTPAQQRAPKSVTAEPSFIGRNCSFEGHITCEGELHIDGTVRGTVQASMCVIDQAGSVNGSVTGNVLHVRGRVLGPLHGSNVYIHAGAHVEGDVFNDTISIENGAYVYGSIRHNTAPNSQATELKAGGLINGFSTTAQPQLNASGEPKTTSRK
jgi:cytoskeletal protein CcmA (bactofilin family)